MKRTGVTGAMLIAALLLIPVTARASEAILPGSKPTAVQRLKIWGFEIYDARLWTSPGFFVHQYASQTFGLEVVYLRRFEGRELAKQSIEAMKKIGTFTPAQESAWFKAMDEIFPNVAIGDQLFSVYKPNVGAEFWSRQKRLGSVSDPEFAKLFFGIWLHEDTSVPAIRQAWKSLP